MDDRERMLDAFKLADAIKEFGSKTPCMDDPDRWFPQQSSDVLDGAPSSMKAINETKALCKTHCFVVAECLAYAVKHREDVGIWGGTSSVERRQIRALRKKMSDPNVRVNF